MKNQKESFGEWFDSGVKGALLMVGIPSSLIIAYIFAGWLGVILFTLGTGVVIYAKVTGQVPDTWGEYREMRNK